MGEIIADSSTQRRSKGKQFPSTSNSLGPPAAATPATTLTFTTSTAITDHPPVLDMPAAVKHCHELAGFALLLQNDIGKL
jgi:hypothetical protein